jgi:hypothetical protein
MSSVLKKNTGNIIAKLARESSELFVTTIREIVNDCGYAIHTNTECTAGKMVYMYTIGRAKDSLSDFIFIGIDDGRILNHLIELFDKREKSDGMIESDKLKVNSEPARFMYKVVHPDNIELWAEDLCSEKYGYPKTQELIQFFLPDESNRIQDEPNFDQEFSVLDLSTKMEIENVD